MKGILMNTQEVQAILEGRKSQHRLPIKNMIINRYADDTLSASYKRQKEKGYFTGHINHLIEKFAPYQVGDILYVKETWGYIELCNNLCCDCEKKRCVGIKYGYKADTKAEHIECSWKPSTRMPKEAARIFLSITNIKVQKLDDFNSSDTAREGFTDTVTYLETWDKSHKKPYQFIDFPWTWVIEFERIEKSEV